MRQYLRPGAARRADRGRPRRRRDRPAASSGRSSCRSPGRRWPCSAMLTFLTAWNDFFWPIIALTSQNPTVQVALPGSARGYVPAAVDHHGRHAATAPCRCSSSSRSSAGRSSAASCRARSRDDPLRQLHPLPFHRREVLTVATVTFDKATRIYPSRPAGRRRPRPRHRRRRVPRPGRPVRLRQVHLAADARRPRGRRRRARSSSATATSPTCRRRTATSRWCSRTTRSTRT